MVKLRPSISALGHVSVGKKTQLTLEPLYVEAEIGWSTTFTGFLTELPTGVGIPEQIVRFYLDDVEIAQTTTLQDGSYSIAIAWTVAGEYTYQVKYLGGQA